MPSATMSSSDDGPQRLQKLIARSGLASRRVADEMIVAGRVLLNGSLAGPGDRADPQVDRVVVDGVPLPVRPDLVTYLLNKPIGVISTSSDPHGRPTVLDIVPAAPRVFTVGRLDADSTGLLLLTNDGDLANHVTHPSNGVTKVYVALVDGTVTRREIDQLVAGVELDDGPATAREARLIGTSRGRSQVELIMNEGRNREVRRMLSAVGHPVLELHRTAVGPIADPRLKPGTFRVLEVEEIRALYASGQNHDVAH